MAGPTTIELLWGTQDQRPRRGPKPSLTLERIVAEAIALADAEGLANLSMARLAERLGCAKMALYRYVPGKAELTALMLDIGLGPAPETPAPGSGAPEQWREYLRDWTETIFDRFRDHPWSLEITPGIRPLGPNELSWLEAALRVLDGSGLNASERLDTVVLLIGHARSLVQQTAPAGPEDELEEGLARQVTAVLTEHGDRYPYVSAAFAETAAQPGREGRDNALQFGIDRILDGIGVLIAERK